MNKQQRKAIAEVFKQAKKLLWDGTPEDRAGVLYICNAVNKTESSIALKIAAIRVIQDRLGGYSTVTQWLFRKHGIYPDTFQELQVYRQAWLDELIKEFSA